MKLVKKSIISKSIRVNYILRFQYLKRANLHYLEYLNTKLVVFCSHLNKKTDCSVFLVYSFYSKLFQLYSRITRNEKVISPIPPPWGG